MLADDILALSRIAPATANGPVPSTPSYGGMAPTGLDATDQKQQYLQQPGGVAALLTPPQRPALQQPAPWISGLALLAGMFDKTRAGQYAAGPLEGAQALQQQQYADAWRAHLDKEQQEKLEAAYPGITAINPATATTMASQVNVAPPTAIPAAPTIALDKSPQDLGQTAIDSLQTLMAQPKAHRTPGGQQAYRAAHDALRVSLYAQGAPVPAALQSGVIDKQKVAADIAAARSAMPEDTTAPSDQTPAAVPSQPSGGGGSGLTLRQQWRQKRRTGAV